MKNKAQKKLKIIIGIATFALWIGAAILGFYTAVSLQEMIFRIYVACCADNRWGFTITRQWSSIILMLVWVSVIVWFGEYQFKHLNEPKSWKLFGWFYLIMMLLLGLGWLI